MVNFIKRYFFTLWDKLLCFFRFRDITLVIVTSSYKSFIGLFKRLPPWYLDWMGRRRARYAYYRAVRLVPAYTQFIANNDGVKKIIPETDKASYIDVYSHEKRCIGGKFPPTGVAIDESSGSTGTPYNWVRTLKERRHSHMFISYFATYNYGSTPWITINAFSMGAWATGTNMGIALEHNGIVKNTGPDIAKILQTLKVFGTRYPYLILGYPPFLKHLIDTAEKEGFSLQEYSLNALVGGEGMSEGLRDYLLKRFKKVYSGYGATDLEIGIGGETPLSVAIRRLSQKNNQVRQKLFGEDSRLPMVFQYNPLMHHVEVNEDNELVFTISRSNLLSPRIRYNVHDQGGIARYDKMAEVLKSVGYDIEVLTTEDVTEILKLPFLWIYGRRDYTISVMGANIYPEDIEQCLYADQALAKITHSFCLSLEEVENGSVRPCFIFEVDSKPSKELEKHFMESIVSHLRKLNADFREAWLEHSKTLVPKVELYCIGEGPFMEDQGKIKQKRLLNKETN